MSDRKHHRPHKGHREPSSERAWLTVLTPEGRGAVGVVRVWGEHALGAANAAFRPHRGRSLAETQPGRLRVGRMGAGKGDEVVAVVIAAEPLEVEVHCHGGPAPLRLVIDALEAQGVKRQSPDVWLGRSHHAALNAQAAHDLAHAPTLRGAEILIDQVQGALDTEVRALREGLTDDSIDSVLERLEALIARAKVGLRLLEGWRVVLAGRPNVGKSRLMNALAGFERAIVDSSPGTTRDLVTVRTALGGWPVELADTAGLRVTDDPIESTGVALARSHQKAADVVPLVLDVSEALSEADRALIESHPDALLVANKSDLRAAWEPWRPDFPVVSALRGDGIEKLVISIAHRIVPEPPPHGVAVPFREAHVRLLNHALEWIRKGRFPVAERAFTKMLGEEAG